MKRLMVFKLASETEDNDDSLGDILQASDNLSRVINLYKKVIEGQVVNGEVDLPATAADATKECHTSSDINSLIDFVGLDVTSPPLPPPPPAEPHQSSLPLNIPFLPPPPVSAHPRSCSSSLKETAAYQIKSTGNSLSLLDEELLCLGLNDPPTSMGAEPTGNSQWTAFQNEQSDLEFVTAKPLLPHPSLSHCGAPATFPAPQTGSNLTAPNKGAFFLSTGAMSTENPPKAAPVTSALHELEVLGQQLLQEAKGSSTQVRSSPITFQQERAQLTSSGAPILIPTSVTPAVPSMTFAINSSKPAGSGSPLFQPVQQGSPLRGSEISLGNVYVPLESIKPSSVLPVTAYDKNGLRVLLHFASECPPGRPDVLVVVVSMLNTAPLPITNIVLQAAVPKSMKVKLQPPSGTELFAFSPIQPPAAITQIMLLANPLKDKVRLRYKLTFLLGDQPNTEVGEMDQFPAVETWGKL